MVSTYIHWRRHEGSLYLISQKIGCNIGFLDSSSSRGCFLAVVVLVPLIFWRQIIMKQQHYVDFELWDFYKSIHKCNLYGLQELCECVAFNFLVQKMIFHKIQNCNFSCPQELYYCVSLNLFPGSENELPQDSQLYSFWPSGILHKEMICHSNHNLIFLAFRNCVNMFL